MSLDDMPTIIRQLRQEWLSSGKSQQEIANATGINRPNFWRFFAYKVDPQLKTVMKIAEYFDCEVIIRKRSK